MLRNPKIFMQVAHLCTTHEVLSAFHNWSLIMFPSSSTWTILEKRFCGPLVETLWELEDYEHLDNLASSDKDYLVQYSPLQQLPQADVQERVRPVKYIQHSLECFLASIFKPWDFLPWNNSPSTCPCLSLDLYDLFDSTISFEKEFHKSTTCCSNSDPFVFSC